MRAKNKFYGVLHSHIVPICSSYPTQATQNRGVQDRNKGKFNSFRGILTDLMLTEELDLTSTSLNN